MLQAGISSSKGGDSIGLAAKSHGIKANKIA